MIEVRLHVVMHRATVSVWCRQVAHDHCLWSGSVPVDRYDVVDQLRVLADGCTEAAVRAERGVLETLTDDCGL